MNRVIIAFVASLFAFPAFADSSASSGSNSGAVSQSGVNIRYGNGHKSTGAAIAPGLIASGLSCQGSVSTGAGGSGWGFSFGMTKMDRDCNTRENAKMIGLMGDVPAGKEVMCGIMEVRRAYAAVGRPCSVDRQRAAVARNNVRNTRNVRRVSAYRDPYAVVRDR